MDGWMDGAGDGGRGRCAGLRRSARAGRGMVARATTWCGRMSSRKGRVFLSPNTEQVAKPLAPAGHHRLRLVSNLAS